MIFDKVKRKNIGKTLTKALRLATPLKTYIEKSNLHSMGIGTFEFGDEKDKNFDVLIDGDSIAAGFGALDISNSVTYLVGRLLSNKFKINITNIGVFGATITRIYKRKIPTKLLLRYNLVIIIGGSNDLFTNVEPNKAARSLNKLLLKYSHISERIIFIGPGKIDILKGIKKEYKEKYREEGLKMSKMFEEVTKKFPNVYYCNPQTKMDPNQRYLGVNLQAEDGFHPNDNGYRLYTLDLIREGLKHFKLI